MPPSLASRLLFHGKADPPFLSPHASPELTAEIYDLIALCLRAYVSPWWTKITRYDKDFLPHISTIVTHFLRALDARTANLDIPDLVFHDIPALLTQHIVDYRNAAAKTHTAYACGGAATLPVLFAGLQPHMAISPTGVLDREYYRQIFDRVLHVCLPPEDYAPDAERIIVREIIVKLLIDDIIPKIAQPWFIQTSILTLLATEEESSFIPKAPPQSQPSTNTSPFSFHTVVVFILSALQSFSGTCLALINSYKHAISTIKLVQNTPLPSPRVISEPSPAVTFVPRSTAMSKSVSAASASTLSSSKSAPSDIIPSVSKIHRATPSLISTTTAASSVLSPDATPTPTAPHTNAHPSVYTAPSFQSPSSSYHQPLSTFQHPLASVPSTSSQTTTMSNPNLLSPQQANLRSSVPPSIPHSPPLEPQKDYAMPPLMLISILLSASSAHLPPPATVSSSNSTTTASSAPRFTTTLILTLTSMICTISAPFLDKLLPYLLHRFLSPAFILNVVRASKRTLFPVPGGYPGPPPPPDPTLEEQAAIRAQTISAIRRTLGLPPSTSSSKTGASSSGPSSATSQTFQEKSTTSISSSSLSLPTLSLSAMTARLLLGPDEAADETIGAALDAFSERECNVRLLVFLLDRVVLGLFPELAGEAV